MGSGPRYLGTCWRRFARRLLDDDMSKRFFLYYFFISTLLFFVPSDQHYTYPSIRIIPLPYITQTWFNRTAVLGLPSRHHIMLVHLIRQSQSIGSVCKTGAVSSQIEHLAGLEMTYLLFPTTICDLLTSTHHVPYLFNGLFSRCTFGRNLIWLSICRCVLPLFLV